MRKKYFIIVVIIAVVITVIVGIVQNISQKGTQIVFENQEAEGQKETQKETPESELLDIGIFDIHFNPDFDAVSYSTSSKDIYFEIGEVLETQKFFFDAPDPANPALVHAVGYSHSKNFLRVIWLHLWGCPRSRFDNCPKVSAQQLEDALPTELRNHVKTITPVYVIKNKTTGYYTDIIELKLTDDTDVSDAREIAEKVGTEVFSVEYKVYYRFLLPTKTQGEILGVVNKIKALEDPRIIGVGQGGKGLIMPLLLDAFYPYGEL